MLPGRNCPGRNTFSRQKKVPAQPMLNSMRNVGTSMSLGRHRHACIVLVSLTAFWPALVEPVQVLHGFGADYPTIGASDQRWSDDHGFSRKAGNLLRQRLHVAKGVTSSGMKPVGSQGGLQKPVPSTFVPIQVKIVFHKREKPVLPMLKFSVYLENHSQ